MPYSTSYMFRFLQFSFHLIMLILLTSAVAEAKMLTITADKVNIRNGPGQKYKIIFQVGAGYPVIELQKKGKWYEIKDFEQDTGWVHESLVNESPQLIVKVNKGTDDTVNIREQPDLNAQVIGKAHYGVVFKKLEEKGGWVLLEHSSGLKGWIKRNLLWGY